MSCDRANKVFFAYSVSRSDSYTLWVDRDLIHAAIAEERRGIADLIDDLDDAQLATPSLCAGWDVKTAGRSSGELSGRGHSQGYVARRAPW